MDPNKIVELFTRTLDHTQREEAEKQLDQAHKIIGFYPTALRVAMDSNLPGAVRQSAAVYVKNACYHEWEEPEEKSGQPKPFSIHEQDKAIIRESIVDAVVMAPDNVSSVLVVCINHIAKHDFPQRWTSIVDKISLYLQHPEKTSWKNVLLALYQLIKVYEYKQDNERLPLEEAMKIFLPLMYQRCCELMADDSNESLLIQKQILKNFYTNIHYHLSQKLFTKDMIMQWMQVITTVIERPIPSRIDQIDEDERPDEPAWKVKKWAINIVYRVFDRYGTPASVQKEYKSFADWYIKTFSQAIITALLKILEQYGNRIYVTPRVLNLTLSYLTVAVSAAFTWKLLKVHINLIIQNIVFPLLCHSKEDQELWEEDPQEFIRLKFDVFEDAVSPVAAASSLLHTTCKKRKGMLEKTLAFVVQILTNEGSDPTMKDGALHMVGSVADVLIKKEQYRDQLEQMIVTYVFPQMESPLGFLRARSCWVMQYFSESTFKNEANILKAVELVHKCLMLENDLPVKVEAAICLQHLVTDHLRAKTFLEPNITPVALAVLDIIKSTENEDLTNVMQKLVCLYSEQIVPVAHDLVFKLAETFDRLIEEQNADESDDKSLVAMSVLNTIDIILSMLDEQPEVCLKIEPVVIGIVLKVLQGSIVDLYEEVFNLIVTITSTQISRDLWKVFEVMYEVFGRDGVDYFNDMAPALHNFITVDPQTFISNQNHVLAIYNMCKTVMTSEDPGEEAEAIAAKLLEVMIIQFKGQIDSCIHPFVELAFTRLTKPCEEELRTMCLQVCVSSLYYNPDLFFQTLVKLQPSTSTQPLFDHFLHQWMTDTHLIRGIHDRKLAVLGLVTLMSLPDNRRPKVLYEKAKEIIPSALLLFEGLKETYAARAKAEAEEDEEGEEEDYDDDSDPEELDDDQDLIPATTMDEGEDQEEDDDEDYDDEDEYDDFEETLLESYTTAIDANHVSASTGDTGSTIDEFIVFKQVLERLQREDMDWFNALMTPLSPDQQKSLQDVMTNAQQRQAAEASKAIEKQGGYNFANSQVPTSFNFGGTPPVA